MTVGRNDGPRTRVHGEALPLGSPHDRAGAIAAARAARQRARATVPSVDGRLSRILLALAALLGLVVAVPAALPSAAAAPKVSTEFGLGGFPIYYEDANGVRLDPCLDASDSHCPLLPDPGFDTQEPIVFPTNFPSEFFYQTVDTGRIPTPGCVGSPVVSAATPGTVQLRIALEGAFANEVPAINDQMVFARVRVIVLGGLCPNTTYTFTHPYGSFDMDTNAEGIIKPTIGTTDIGCVPTTQVTCDFSIALTSTMLTNGFLRWDPNIAPAADPGYLAGDPATLHEITGGVANVNTFTVTETANPLNVVASTNLFTVSGRLAGPIAAAPQLLDFGGVVVGQTVTQDVTLTNIGDVDWILSNASVNNAAFTVTNLDCPTAAPGLLRDLPCQVRVSFTPGAVGQVGFDGNTLLSVGHDGLHSPFTMVVRGTGINPGAEAGVVVAPTALNFGQVRVGLLGPAQTVSISNNGQAPLEVQSLEFVTTDASFDVNDDEAFRLTFDGCTGAIIAEGGVAHCDLLVAFQPTVAHAYVAALRIHANVSGEPTQIDLQATGIGGVAAVSKDAGGGFLTDPTNGFPVWYQDELGQRVGQCLDALDPYCVVLPDDFYTGGIVGGISGSAYVNFPEEFFWYQAESDAVATDGCNGTTDPGDAFVGIAGEGAFVNGSPVVGEGMSFGRVRISADGLCANTEYTVVHPYGTATVETDDLGRVRRGIGTQDIGCVPLPGEECDWAEALASPVFGGFLRQINPPAGYLGDPNTFQAVTGAPYIAQREIDAAGPGGVPAAANYFRIYKTDAPLEFNAETTSFSVMGKLVGPMMATPGAIDYGQVEVGLDSAPTVVEITNDGTVPATVTAVSVTGLMPADFAITGDDCSGVTLDAASVNPANATCTIEVTFSPTANGPRTAEVSVTHTALNNPLRVRLTGVGGAQAGFPAISVNPISLDFPDLHTGQVSASESVRVSNVGGSAPLHVTPTITGVDAGNFSITENTCDPEVLPNEECVIRVNFSPTAAGPHAAALELDHDAPLVADPLPVPLSGRGFAGAPAQSASQIPAGFPTWFQDNNGVRVDACLTQGDPGCVLLAGPGYNPAQPISFPANFPPEFFWYMAETDPTFQVEDPTCGAVGTAALRVAIEGTFGTGQALPGDQLMFDRIRIGVDGLCPNTTYHFVHPYGTDLITTDGDGAGVFTDDLTNMLNNAPLSARTNIADLGAGGLLRWDPVDSPAAPAGYLGDAVSFHTVVGSTFRPEGPGTEPANYFEVTADDGVGGLGERLARTDGFVVAGRVAGPIETDVSSVAFGNQAQGTSATRSVTVTNLSNDDVTVTPSIGGADAAVFAVLGSGTCAVDPVLSRDEACTIDIEFAPTLADPVGNVSASLVIAHDGAHSPTNVALTGTVTNPGQAEITYTPATLAFANQTLNVPSIARVVTVTNTGTAPLTFGNIVVGGANADQFTAADNCADLPASLAVGASCTVTVTFTPTGSGNKSAVVQIATNDPVRPNVFVTLSGTGVAPQVSASPTSLSFATKGSSTKSITLTNTGTAPFSLVGAPALLVVEVGSDNAQPATKFTAGNNGCNNVAPGGKCTVSVTFTPGAGPSNQTFTARLRISSNAVNSVIYVSLSGQRK